MECSRNSGITVFIPQIAVLFTLIAILEESGYMSRVVFLMDNVMRRFGLSGKSVVPLISGAACAVPAVMIARNIESLERTPYHHTRHSVYDLLGTFACVVSSSSIW